MCVWPNKVKWVVKFVQKITPRLPHFLLQSGTGEYLSRNKNNRIEVNYTWWKYEFRCGTAQKMKFSIYERMNVYEYERSSK